MSLSDLIRPGALRAPPPPAPTIATIATIAVARPPEPKTDPPPLTDEDQASITEAVVERAAIMEFDGGLPRDQAEHQARSSMRVYRVLVGMMDTDPRWCTLLAPGCDMAEAQRAAVAQFGAERVLEVVDQTRLDGG